MQDTEWVARVVAARAAVQAAVDEVAGAGLEQDLGSLGRRGLAGGRAGI
jgi:hypothetical protein